MTAYQSRVWLALRVGAWLCVLPLGLRRPLPALFARHRRIGGTRPGLTPEDLDLAVRTIHRVCLLPLFTLPIFPRTCLRTSLALYHFLGAMGCRVRVHIGVRRQGASLAAHSWVTVDDRILIPDTATEFRTLYTCPDPCRIP